MYRLPLNRCEISRRGASTPSNHISVTSALPFPPLFPKKRKLYISTYFAFLYLDVSDRLSHLELGYRRILQKTESIRHKKLRAHNRTIAGVSYPPLSRSYHRTFSSFLLMPLRLRLAHAKIMFRNVVTLQDAVVAVIMTESSLASSAILGSASTNTVRSLIPEHPEAECTSPYHRIPYLCSHFIIVKIVSKKPLSCAPSIFATSFLTILLHLQIHALMMITVILLFLVLFAL